MILKVMHSQIWKHLYEKAPMTADMEKSLFEASLAMYLFTRKNFIGEKGRPNI